MAQLGHAAAGMGNAGGKGRGHVVPGDQTAHQRLCVLRQIPQAAGIALPQHPFQIVLIQPLT